MLMMTEVHANRIIVEIQNEIYDWDTPLIVIISK